MPDEVETRRPASTSIGYKSSQCNALYYNPAPDLHAAARRYDGTPVRRRSVRRAPATPASATSTRSPTSSHATCNTQFVAYDATTLEVPTPALPTRRRPRYYYVYTGPRDARATPPRPARRSTPAATDRRRRAAAPGRGTTSSTAARRRSKDELRDLVLVLPDPARADQERGQPRLRAAQRHQARRLHHGRAEGLGRHRPAINPHPLPADRRLQSGAAQKDKWFNKLFSQIAARRFAGARRPGPGRPLLRRQGRQHQHRTCRPRARTTRSSTRASRTSRS